MLVVMLSHIQVQHIITGSIQLTGSYYQQLQDNEDWTTEYIPTANATTPNFIFAKQGAYDSTGVNNILMGVASSATGTSVNRFIGFNGSNNHSNAIIAGYNNFISGSAGSRSSNVILGGNNNAFFRRRFSSISPKQRYTWWFFSRY
jgi:hypothetical protein